MLFEFQNGDSGDTKIDPNSLNYKKIMNDKGGEEEEEDDDDVYNTKNNKITIDTNTNSLTNDNINYSITSIRPSSGALFAKLTNKVLSSKDLIEHILSYIPIGSLGKCSRVCSNWSLIIKYMVPIPLVHLRTLSIGELVYWLPGENQFPKTVLLKLRFSSGAPKFLELLTSVDRSKTNKKHKNGFSKSHEAHNNDHESIIVRNGHYQLLELSEILFVISGHWTPIFESLNELHASNDTFDMDESQFFHRSKCFSIVTNTYMTYDFISFNSATNESIVHTMRSIIHQNHQTAQKMAIFAKANKKYLDGIQNIPLIFKDPLSALNFEMFVLILQDCKNKVGSELNIDIPTIIAHEANASLLYPMILEENVIFSEWYPWVRAHILDVLKKNGYIKSIEEEEDDLDDSDVPTEATRMKTISSRDSETDNIEVLYDGKKHNRRQSSLFGLQEFPQDESYDLFSGIRNSDDDEEYDDDTPYKMNINHMNQIYDSSLNTTTTTDNHQISNNHNNNNDSPECKVM